MTSGSGQPFGGKTPFDNGSAVSDKGAVQLSKAPVVSADTQADSDIRPQPQNDADIDRDASGSSDVVAGGAADHGQTKPGAAPDGSAQPGAVPAGTLQSGTLQSADAGQSAAAQSAAAQPGATPADAKAASAQAGPAVAPMTGQQEQAAFRSAADQIREAVRNDPALAALAPQLAIDDTPEGLRIQLLDEEKKSMFPFGSSVPNDRARLLLLKIAPVLAHLTEEISITGHTDAAPFRGVDKSNWELSTERANATRRVLVDAGLGDQRYRSVTGDADRDPLLPGDPLAAANRRIAIVVLRSVHARGRVPAAVSPARPLPAAPAKSPARAAATRSTL